MNHIKTILFLLLSLAVGVGIGRVYLMIKGRTPAADFTYHGKAALLTGTGDAPAWRGFAVKDPAHLQAALAASGTTFATAIGIQYSPAWNAGALKTAVQEIHEKRLHAVLLPPAVFASQNPYSQDLAAVAADAQAAGINALCISWLNTPTDGAYWQAQADAVRNVFKGRIIFAGTPEALGGLSCWEAGDMLGAIGPLPLPRRLPHSPANITTHDARAAWFSTLTTLEFLAQAHGMKLALLNMNVPVEVSARLPAPDAADTPAANPALQQMLYNALLLETKGRTAHTDILFFTWGAEGDKAAPNNIRGLLDTLGTAWDPKNSKSAATEPATSLSIEQAEGTPEETSPPSVEDDTSAQ